MIKIEDCHVKFFLKKVYKTATNHGSYNIFFLTFFPPILLIFSCPHTTEAFPLLSHKHHAVFAESSVCHENLTPIRPPALSHRAIAGSPAKHLTAPEKRRRKGNKSLSHFSSPTRLHMD